MFVKMMINDSSNTISIMRLETVKDIMVHKIQIEVAVCLVVRKVKSFKWRKLLMINAALLKVMNDVKPTQNMLWHHIDTRNEEALHVCHFFRLVGILLVIKSFLVGEPHSHEHGTDDRINVA
jgi:hypothetical protein